MESSEKEVFIRYFMEKNHLEWEDLPDDIQTFFLFADEKEFLESFEYYDFLTEEMDTKILNELLDKLIERLED